MINRLGRKALRWFSRYRLENEGPTIYEIKSRIISFADLTVSLTQAILPFFALLCFGLLIYDAGFNDFYEVKYLVYEAWFFLLVIIEILLVIYFLLNLKNKPRIRPLIFNLILIVFTHVIQRGAYRLFTGDTIPGDGYFLPIKLLVYAGTMFLFISEATYVLRYIYQRGINPAFLFSASFFLFIGFGALLLMVPNATVNGIHPVDAWFTSASAICVTGLTVVDTAATFTTEGKLILLALIQLGGLGIMTFAGLLTYLASGSVSFRNQLALKDMLSSNQLGGVINWIGRVVVVTLFFEALGALFIYQTLDDTLFTSIAEKIFFSIFHSVSAFCNAGFSTYTNGLYELPIRFNYNLHLVIAMLIVLGGIGFPIVFSIFNYFRVRMIRLLYTILKKPFYENHIHIINTTSRLALATTGILLIFGFVTFFVFERNASLLQHPSLYGKMITSLFGSITPRTAGFNTVDLTVITLPTVMIYLLLMWIGASPGSTGGGIKTTTIAVAFLNLRTVALGKNRTEVAHTQVGDTTIHRAFAIILLSLLVIGVTVLILAINEPDKSLFALAFESFSAFSTVGLTLGITANLTIISKLVLSFVMLIGRVGTLTILFAFITQAKTSYHKYPREEILL